MKRIGIFILISLPTLLYAGSDDYFAFAIGTNIALNINNSFGFGPQIDLMYLYLFKVTLSYRYNIYFDKKIPMK
jgi:hypothetical protein